MPSSTRADDPSGIAQRILVLRGQRVLLDADLAALYGVSVKRLNEQVKRNRARFPGDFVFQPEINEIRFLRSQFATIDTGRGRHSKYPPLAFTEHGAIMAAMVLNSPRAVEMSVYIVRAFVKLRDFGLEHGARAASSMRWRNRSATLDATTRQQFEEVYAAIRALMAPLVTSRDRLALRRSGQGPLSCG